jgi:hypothetical protein
MGESVKVNLRNLEEYDSMGDAELGSEIIKYQGALENIPREITDDIALQKAISVVASMKEKHTSKRKQCKAILDTLNLLARSRGLL